MYETMRTPKAVAVNPEALEKEDFFLDTRMVFFYRFQAKITSDPVTIQTTNP